jgi:hypothetical protein
MLQKPVQSKQPSGAYCEELQVDYPTLADFLCQDFWDENGKRSVRVPGSITVFCEQGKLKCCVNDRDFDRVAFLTFDGPDTFWAQLEGHMAKDDWDWRDKQPEAKRKK